MMYLYPSTQTDFSHNGEPLRHAYDSRVFRKKGQWYVTFKVLLDEAGEYKKVRRGKIVSAKTLDGVQHFRIIDRYKRTDHIEFEALHLFFDLGKKAIKQININNQPLSIGIEQVKSSVISGLGKFTLSSSIDSVRTFNTDKDSKELMLLEALIDGKHSIVGTWDAELLINDFDIRLVPRVGNTTHALLYEKKNISDFADDESDKDLVTRIYAHSEFLPEGKSGDENKVKIDIVVDSPLINDYPIIYEKHYVNNDCKTEAELRQWAQYKYTYDKMDIPTRSINLKTNIIDGTVINYGDTLVLKYLKHDVDEEIRCCGYENDGITGDVFEIDLGSNITTVSDVVSSSIQDSTKSYQNEIQKQIERVTMVLMAANGYNRNAFGPDPVPNPIENDKWYKFQFDNPNHVEVYRWDGTQWVLILDDYTGERVKEAIAAVEAQAKDLDAAVKATDQKAVEALNKAGLSTDLATTAKNAADKANSDLSAYKSSNDTLVNKAINDVLSINNDLSNNIKPTVNKALTDASSALSQAQANGGKITNLTTDVDKVKGEVALKITQAQADSLINSKGYATTTELTAKAGELSSSISKVSGELANLSIGGRNYALNSKVWDYYSNNNSSAPIVKEFTSEYIRLKNSGIGTGVDLTVTSAFNSNYGNYSSMDFTDTDYTLSTKIKTEKAGLRLRFNAIVYYEDGTIYYHVAPEFLTTADWKTVSVTIPKEKITKKVKTVRFWFLTNDDTRDNWLYIKEHKFETGNKYTDYSPAPEDMATQANLEITNTRLTQTDKDIQAVATRVTNTENNITNAQSSIKLNSDAIALRATKEEMLAGDNNQKTYTDTQIKVKSDEISALVTRATNAEKSIAEIKVTADGASQNYTKLQTDFNNLKIGGRNLLLGSDKVSTNKLYSTANYKWADVNDIVAGEEYTITIWGKLSNYSTGWYTNIQQINPSAFPSMIVLSNNSNKIAEGVWRGTFKMTNLPVGATWTGLSLVYPYPLNNAHTEDNTIYKIKIERGNKGTDFSIAPEELLALQDFTAFKGEYEQSNAANKAKITEVENKVNGAITVNTSQQTAIDQNKNSIELRATKEEVIKGDNTTLDSAKTDATTKANTAETNAKTYANAQIKVESDKITTRVSSVENTLGKGITGDGGLITKINETKITADSTYNMIMVNDGSGKSLKTKVNETIDKVDISKKTIAEIAIKNELSNTSFLNSVGNAQGFSCILKPYSDGVICDSVNSAGIFIGLKILGYLFSGIDYAISMDIPNTAMIDASSLRVQLTYSDATNQVIPLALDPVSNRYFATFKPLRSMTATIQILAKVLTSPGSFRVGRVMLAKNSTTQKLFISDADAQVGNLSSEVTQMAGSWGVQIKSANEAITSINANASGVEIDARLIHIKGTTLIDNGVIKDAHIGSLSASKITAGTIDAAKITVINIDASKITANLATLSSALFNGVNSRVKITGDYIDFVGNNGYTASRVYNFGTQYFRDGISAGWFQVYQGGVGIIADGKQDVILGWRDTIGTTGFTTSLRINATNREIVTDMPLQISGGIWGPGRAWKLKFIDYQEGIALVNEGTLNGIFFSTRGPGILYNGYLYDADKILNQEKRVYDWINANISPYLHTHS